MGTDFHALASSEATIQQIEQLASLLEAHSLTHLEYSEGTTHLLLKKEPAPQAAPVPASPSLLSAAFPSSADTLTKAPLADTSSGTDTEAIAHAVSGVPETAIKETQLVTAPLLGVAYRAKEPGAPPFVDTGGKVEEGTVLCLIEAMKMFNEVKAPCSGIIQAVHMTDGELVEFGAPLFSLEALPGAQTTQQLS